MSCDYPIFLDLRDKLAVVIGGGEVGARKVDKLLSAGVRVRVVAREISEAVESLTRQRGGQPGQLELVRANFVPDHLRGAFLVFACTDNEQVNAHVAAAARAAGALVNRADAPDDCDFFVPAASQHGPIKLAISTGGGSPALAKLIRKWLDTNLPAELATLADELARARPIVQQRLAEPAERAAIWQTLCGDESIRLLAEQGVDAWREWFGKMTKT